MTITSAVRERGRQSHSGTSSFHPDNSRIRSQPVELQRSREEIRCQLHKVGSADENKHVVPIRRGFVGNAGDANWTDDISKPDPELLPQLNTYYFRCHSSVRFHVFQKQVVVQKKGSITSRLQTPPPSKFRMPQDRILGADLIRQAGRPHEQALM
ncbi:MAG: small molecule metabolism [Acidobacteria bacterium]|nr:small molecule metabolism [Acidobacteriota bacterium]